MTTYVIAETVATGYVNNPALWTACDAASLAAAKRAASHARVFHGTAAHVGALCADGTVEPVAVCRPKNALDMRSRMCWTDYDDWSA